MTRQPPPLRSCASHPIRRVKMLLELLELRAYRVRGTAVFLGERTSAIAFSLA